MLGSLIVHLHVHGMTVHSLRIHCILCASTHTHRLHLERCGSINTYAQACAGLQGEVLCQGATA